MRACSVEAKDVTRGAIFQTSNGQRKARNREQGTGNREWKTRNWERGTRKGEWRKENREREMGNGELGNWNVKEESSKWGIFKSGNLLNGESLKWANLSLEELQNIKIILFLIPELFR